MGIHERRTRRTNVHPVDLPTYKELFKQYLLNHPLATSKDIAKHFGVDVKTVVKHLGKSCL